METPGDIGVHPLVQARNETVKAARAAIGGAERRLDARLRSAFSEDRLRPATPEDVTVGAVIWHPVVRPAGPDGTYEWDVVGRVRDPRTGAFETEDGFPFPTLDDCFVLDGAGEAQDSPEAVLLEDVRGDAREAWLLDTGHFLVPDEVHPAWWASLRWRRLMRQRRALRVFVPLAELPRLAALARSFRALKRGYEMTDALRRHREQLDALESLVAAGAPEEDVKAQRSRVRASLGTAEAHARLVEAEVPERASPIRTVPYLPPPVTWDEARNAGKDAGKGAARQDGKGRRPDPAA